MTKKVATLVLFLTLKLLAKTLECAILYSLAAQNLSFKTIVAKVRDRFHEKMMGKNGPKDKCIHNVTPDSLVISI